MRKLSLGLTLATLSLLFVFTTASANSRPKGLADRGPLTKITFIHYRRGAKPPGTPGGGNGKGGGGSDSGPSCYGFLAKGVLWKEANKDIHVNAADSGMASEFVRSTVDTSATTWNSQTSFDFYGSSVLDNGANWETNTPDFTNEVSFGPYSNSGVIAVTNVWGYFGGPPQTREIVDFDILFNTHYTWGNSDSDGNLVMDFQNIATHELGHGFGLDDMYDTSCSAVTMYGYSDYGETQKRTLETPDVTGIQALYN